MLFCLGRGGWNGSYGWSFPETLSVPVNDRGINRDVDHKSARDSGRRLICAKGSIASRCAGAIARQVLAAVNGSLIERTSQTWRETNTPRLGGSAFVAMVKTTNLGNRKRPSFGWLHVPRIGRVPSAMPNACRPDDNRERTQVEQEAAFIEHEHVI